MSAVVKLAEEINDVFLQQCAESNVLLSLSSHAEVSMRVIPSNSVSTHNADTMSAVVKLAEKIDDIFLRHGAESNALRSPSLPVECWLCEVSMRVILSNTMSAMVKLAEEIDVFPHCSEPAYRVRYSARIRVGLCMPREFLV